MDVSLDFAVDVTSEYIIGTAVGVSVDKLFEKLVKMWCECEEEIPWGKIFVLNSLQVFTTIVLGVNLATLLQVPVENGGGRGLVLGVTLFQMQKNLWSRSYCGYFEAKRRLLGG